jgi:hypothetical protein
MNRRRIIIYVEMTVLTTIMAVMLVVMGAPSLVLG